MTIPFFRDSISRRAALGGLPLAAALLGAPTMAGGTVRRTEKFDPDSPVDNLRLWMKLQYSLVREPVWSYFGGMVYAIEGDLPPRRLFALDGFGQGWAELQPDGSYHIAWKEIGFLKDPLTDRILERWHNPLIDEDVDVRHIMNPAANSKMAITDEGMGLGFSTGQVDQAPRNYRNPERPNDFILPWHSIGDYTSVWNDVTLAMNHTLDPKIWVRESSGSRIAIGEFLQLVARTSELFDESRTQVSYTGSWERVASWHPWMMMGQRPGKLFYRCTTQRLAGAHQIPPALLAATQQRAPEYLVQPTSWGPRYSTWKDFLATQKPKPPK